MLYLTLEVESLKQEYNSLKINFMSEQGSPEMGKKSQIKLEVNKMELLRRVIREKEQKLFIMRFLKKPK